MLNFKEVSAKVVPVLASVPASMFLAVNAFAADDAGMTTAMTTAFTKVQTDAMAAIGVAAPIALGIAGVFIVWKLGIKFFKGIAK